MKTTQFTTPDGLPPCPPKGGLIQRILLIY